MADSQVTVLSKSPGDILNFLARRLEPLAKVEEHLLKLEERVLSEDVEKMTPADALARYERLSAVVLRHIELLSNVMRKDDVETYMKSLGIIDLFIKLKNMPIDRLVNVNRLIDGEEADIVQKEKLEGSGVISGS